MNWDAIGAIANLVAALGVLVSLVYLAIQVKQNTRSVRQQAFQIGTNEVRRWSGRFAESRDVAELYLRGQQDYAALGAADQVRFTMLVFEICSIWATYLEHSEEDLLGLRQSAEYSLGRWIRQGWFTPWFAAHAHMFSPAFNAFVRRLIDRHPAAA
ncbi:MAG: hypothetical protein J0M16_09345 [Gammaproteobacteria bacterium]|jgi:hypothetical protein|nr:hypothetical protein [Gammaproteobacteria bacterium]